MRRAVTCAAAAVLLLSGCAKTAPPLPAALPSAGSTTSASSVTSSTSQSAVPSASSVGSGTPSSSMSRPSVAPKVLATLKLPTGFGAYQASTTTGTGEQQVVYANPNDANDTLNVVVTGLADVTTIASAYTGAVLNGPAICGTVSSNSATVASCTLPLDKGAIVVTGAGTQTIATVAAAASALWAGIA
jgi:hypothetical protein